MQGKIFSPGKLLLTAEYAVLDGALALAVPTKLGQQLQFSETVNANSTIYWKTLREGALWLGCKIDYRNWKIVYSNLQQPAEFILKVFKTISELSPEKFSSDTDYSFEADIEFPADFGLGSSSTLMNNLAGWAEIDAFQLNENCLGGSGYDVAVAQKKTAVLYQLHENGRTIKTVDFHPPFADDLIFIHLNHKQDSREGISLYRSLAKSKQLIDELSDITNKVLTCNKLEEFSALMEQHEQFLSQHLDLPTVKQKYFSDAPAFVKSLGAWGGDFALSHKFGGWENYFAERGFTTVFNYGELIC